MARRNCQENEIDPKAVSKWFNGVDPKARNTEMLASLIGTSASYLLGDATNDGIETGHFLTSLMSSDWTYWILL
jgi:hypothetical protein